MIKKIIKKYFNSKPLHLKDINEDTGNQNFIFVLKYQNEEIGYLKYSDGEWLFSYSDWFKNQNEIETLLEFPENTESYTSNELWAFFANRIPSFKQPSIKKFIENNPDEKNNLAKLLELFGKYSVNNPFILEANY